MGEYSHIEWTDHTFNPWIGCTKVSDGCTHCYAERDDNRRKWTPDGWGKGKPRRLTSKSTWRNPMKWNRKAAKLGLRFRVFCASLADVFDEEVVDDWRHSLFALIAESPNLDWLLLTKRPEKMREWMRQEGGSPPNVWLGVSVEDQSTADERIPILLSTSAAVRFVSYEPALGPVDFQRYLPHDTSDPTVRFLGAEEHWLDWIIAGGESGPGARPMHPDWARSIRDQCAEASVPFFFKQWGEWMPIVGRHDWGHRSDHLYLDTDDSQWKGQEMKRVRKSRSGRMIDGREWTQYPYAQTGSVTNA